MDRPSRDLTYLKMAELMALRGTCKRAKVGCVIAVDNRVVVVSYNGALPNHEHCTDTICNSSAPCLNSVHAEANAIYFAAKKGIPLEGGTIYVTHSPCNKCAEAIIQAGIKKVIFGTVYRDTNFATFESSGVEIEQLKERVKAE